MAPRNLPMGAQLRETATKQATNPTKQPPKKAAQWIDLLFIPPSHHLRAAALKELLQHAMAASAEVHLSD